MLHITRLKIRGFKSFKFIDVPIPRDYLCLAGPNGSGKSNFTDAIRFVLGESSLKALRAKKVRDLIHSGGNTAEVTLYFDGDEQMEFKRAIRSDGKILYKLNGKKTTRTAILEALKKHNLDESGRNIIAQGQVQEIIKMSPRERRGIIDAVAGIADFDAKKDEALGELGKVDAKLNDANLVLGEKTAFLNELGREKEVALQYGEHRKKHTNAKATILKREIDKYEKDFNAYSENDRKLAEAIALKQTDMDGFDAKRKVIEGKKKEIVDELAAKQKYQSLIGLIERLKGAIRSNEDMIKEKQEQQRKLDTEELKTGKETEKCKAEIAAVEAEMVKMRAELRTLEAEASKYAATAETNEMERLTANIEEQTKKERETSDALVKGESEITAKNELMAGKKHEIEAINASLGIKQDSAQDKAKTEIDGLKAEIGSISKEIDDIFQRERELHQESANLDKRLLELREKSSVMRVQTSPAMANPALKTIQELKNQGEMDGIFGTVADLIKFETKFTAAVEAAAGNRLLYVVVRDSDVATKIIRHLKKIGGGRATFIPLREIRVSESPPKSNYPSVASILKHSIEVKKAIDYVFGETLLMTDIEDAKRFGIGNARMVTLDGEVFERSGIISGGKVATSILAASQLAKMEQEIADVKTSKETVLRELSSLREEGNSKRSEKAAIEIRLRTIEIELRSDDERLKSNEKSVNRKKQLEIEVAEIVTFIKEKGAELEKLKAEQKNLAKKISELRVTFAQVEAKSKEVADETAKKRNELTANISANRATLEAKNEELKLRKEELFEKEERLKEIGKEKKELMENLKNLQKQVTTDSGELATNEEKLSSLGKQAEKLNAAMKEYEAELQKIGEELGKLKIEIDRHTKERYSLESKRETARQRLADFKGEFERYKEFEMLDAKKDELEQMVKNAEEFMNSNPNVNMGAIEAHEKKKTEVEELQKNIETLNGEKNAVLQMINEIDARKKESFYETFDAVSDRFRHLFEKVHIGQGFLHLDNPNEPFQSGLHIKLRRNNHDHSIESLSGGENTIMALLFVFSLQFVKPSPFYILDEVDAALDKENSKTVSDFVKNMAGDAQFILVSHNDQVIANATAVLGVSRVDGVSKIVGIKLEQTVKTAV